MLTVPKHFLHVPRNALQEDLLYNFPRQHGEFGWALDCFTSDLFKEGFLNISLSPVVGVLPQPPWLSDMMESSLVRTCLYLQATNRSHGPVWVKPSPASLDLTLIHCCLFFSWNHFFGQGRDLIGKDQSKEHLECFRPLCELPLNPLHNSAVSTFILFRFSLLMYQLKLLRALHVPSKFHLSLSLVFPDTILTWYGNVSKFSFIVCHCFYLLYTIITKMKSASFAWFKCQENHVFSLLFYGILCCKKNSGFIAIHF